MGKGDRDLWYVFRDLPCLDCGYNLRRQTGPEVGCPECGQVNDLTDATQWQPQLQDGTPIDFTVLICAGMLVWALPAMILVFLWAAIFENGDASVWLTVCLTAFVTIAHFAFLLRSLKKRMHQIQHWGKAILIFALATLVTGGPFLSMLLAYLAGYLLSWQWPLAIAAGFVVAYLSYDYGSKLMPDAEQKYKLPPWLRYCDAIKEQHRNDNKNT